MSDDDKPRVYNLEGEEITGPPNSIEGKPMNSGVPLEPLVEGEPEVYVYGESEPDTNS